MKPLPLACLAFAAGLAGGWFTVGGTGADGPVVDAPPPSPRVAARQQRQKEKAGIPADVVARLAVIRAATTPADRLKATIQLAQTLPVPEMERWFENQWFDFRDGTDENVFYEIARRRWLEEAPEGLMEVALRKNWDDFDKVAGQWARLDPDAAIAYLERRRDPEGVRKLQLPMMDDLAKQRPEWVIARIRETPGNGQWRQWTSTLNSLAEKHPAKLAAAIDDLPAALRMPAETALVTARLVENFDGEISNLLQRPDGKNQLQRVIGTGVGSKEISEMMIRQLHRLPGDWLNDVIRFSDSLTNADPGSWLSLDLVKLGVDEDVARLVTRSALDSLARNDPQEVLNFVSASSGRIYDHSNILGQALRELEQRKPGEAADWLDRQPASPELAGLRKELEAALAPTFAGGNPVALSETLRKMKDDPAAGKELMTGFWLAPAAVREDFHRQLERLEPEQQAVIGHGILGQYSQLLPFELRADLLAAVIARPGAVWETPSPAGAGAPVAAVEVREASLLAGSWVLQDAAAATRWVATLPAGEARQWALRNMAAGWMPYDDRAARGWIAALPAAERADVREFLEKR